MTIPMTSKLLSAFLLAVSVASAQPELTMAQYQQVRLGMRYDEVCRVLGFEGEQVSLMKVGGLTTAGYRWRRGNAVIIGVFQSRIIFPLSTYGVYGGMTLKSKQQLMLAPATARAPNTAAPINEEAPVPQPAMPAVKTWEVVSIDGKIIDSNGSVCHYAWRMSIKNNSDHDLSFAGTVAFVDQDGSSVDSSGVVGLRVAPHTQQEFTGSKMMMVESAQTVVKPRVQFNLH